MTTYDIFASIDDGSPNNVILFSSEDEQESRTVYEKLKRLNDLQFPETPELKKEFDELYFNLSNEYSINIFNEECEWDLIGLFKTERLD